MGGEDPDEDNGGSCVGGSGIDEGGSDDGHNENDKNGNFDREYCLQGYWC